MNRLKYSCDSFDFFIGKSDRNNWYWSDAEKKEPRFAIDFRADWVFQYEHFDAKKSSYQWRQEFDAEPEELKGLADFIYEFLGKDHQYLKAIPWGITEDKIEIESDKPTVEYTHSIEIPKFIQNWTHRYNFKILKHGFGTEGFEAFSISVPENLLDEVDWISYDFTKKELKSLADFIYDVLGEDLISRMPTKSWGLCLN